MAVDGYHGQQRIEQVFRGLKGGDWLRWGPMYHWTDSKIRVHAFYCMLGISLLQATHKKAQSAWPGISMEKQSLSRLRSSVGCGCFDLLACIKNDTVFG